MRFQNALLYWVGVSALLASGCALDSASEAETSVEQSEVTVLADIQLKNGHRVQFVETIPGAVTLSETGIPVGEQALLAKLGNISLQEKYVALGVPIEPATFDKLRAAQERVDKLNAEVEELEAAGLGPEIEAPSVATKSGAIGSQSQALVSEVRNGHWPGFDTERLFVSTWCSGAQLCQLFQTGSWDTGFPGDVRFFSSIVMNLGPNGALTHNHRQYVCLTSIWPIGCVSRGWRTVNTQNVIVGNYGYYSDTYKWTRYSASIPSGSSIFGAAKWQL
jgi:hypothetical protein